MVNMEKSCYYNITTASYGALPGSSIYCAINNDKSLLVAIALTENFYYDLSLLLKKVSYESVYLVTPNIGMYYISDIYSTWKLCKNLNKKIKILCNEPKWVNILPEFQNDIIQNESFDIYDLDRDNDGDYFSLSIDLIPTNKDSAKYGNDIMLKEDDNIIYFMLTPDVDRINELLHDPTHSLYVNEIHIPVTQSLFGGKSYDEIVKAINKDDTKYIYAHSIPNKIYMSYVYLNGVNIKEYTRDVFI